MSEVKWVDSHIEVAPPKRPKKITGTRLAAILDLNRWSTPFEIWCAITRTYEEPFEDNKYTIAGKVIEPKIINYLNKTVFFGDLKSPTDIYGKNYFRKTWGDFYHEAKIFGGMWDALEYQDGVPVQVIEIKTTKRAEDWKNGAPEYYAIQAALYAYLLGVDKVMMVASMLHDGDYEHPEKFVPSVDNTIIDCFNVSERFPQFSAHISRAVNWWQDHVLTGISPNYDEKRDKDILKALRQNNVSVSKDIKELLAEGEQLKTRIDEKKTSFARDEKRLAEINNVIRGYCMDEFREGDKQVVMSGKDYDWVLSRNQTVEINKTALKKDGLLSKYSTSKVAYRFTQKKKKGETA